MCQASLSACSLLLYSDHVHLKIRNFCCCYSSSVFFVLGSPFKFPFLPGCYLRHQTLADSACVCKGSLPWITWAFLAVFFMGFVLMDLVWQWTCTEGLERLWEDHDLEELCVSRQAWDHFKKPIFWEKNQWKSSNVMSLPKALINILDVKCEKCGPPLLVLSLSAEPCESPRLWEEWHPKHS